jgi:glycosyltransferase involved in cell wall biosynthesis
MMKREICTNFQLAPKDVGLWTNGVSTEKFAPDATMRKKMRARLGLNGKFVVLYHGVLTANRGISQAIASISLLNGKYRNTVLFVLGNGPALSDLMSTSRQEAAEGRVIFHEPVDFSLVPQYISACDIGIVPLPDLPDWRNQCALNLLECLSMAKVVVATDIPANREVTGKSKCVIYADSSGSNSLTRAIIHAFDNRSKLGEWGATGRALMKEKYEWSKVAQSLERYLSDCAS